jgi:hypothetical protein
MFPRIFECLCAFVVGTAAHAEPGSLDDVIITDKTNYLYCQDSTNRIVSTVRPPYYVALRCIDFHSTNPLLTTKCTSYMGYSYCSVQDCEQEVRRNAKPQPLGGSATMQNVCANVDEYGQWTIIVPSQEETEGENQ